ncbi:MAG TPA: MerR family transcriptional regulator [Kofleriaceae bacterium]
MTKDESRLMRVGELAKAVGKTVRAMHLYEELGLLEPRSRSDGGFRMYGPEAVDRIHWIVKLQAIGFTLAEIQGFVGDFEGAGSGRAATSRVRALFTEKQAQIRAQIIQLQVIENDLSEAVAYLDSCQTCSEDYAPRACGDCDHHGHQKGEAPPLFAGLSRRPVVASCQDPREPGKDAAKDGAAFDVPVTGLFREGNN